MDLITVQKPFGADEACRAHLESVLWPAGPVCTACGCVDNAHRVRTRTGLRRGLEVWREKGGQGMAEPTPLRVYACGESSAGAGTVVPFATGTAKHASPKQELKEICATQDCVDAA